MLIRISSNGENFSEHIYKEIANITDLAILHIDDVKYDKKNKVVHLLIERFKYRGVRYKLLGIIETPQYDTSVRIKSSITINKVISCEIQNNYSDKVSETTIHMGMFIRDNKIYMCSWEDDYGTPLYAIEIEVSDIDITISDI